jgi:hypothetical protein
MEGRQWNRSKCSLMELTFPQTHLAVSGCVLKFKGNDLTLDVVCMVLARSFW